MPAVFITVLSLLLMSLMLSASAHALDRMRPGFFQGRLWVSPVPIVGQRGIISLELTATAGDCRNAIVQFRTPTGVMLLGPGTFGDQYFVRGSSRRYFTDIRVLEEGCYALQATVYFQLPGGQNRAEHFFIYLTAGTANSWIERDVPRFTARKELQMEAQTMLAPSAAVHQSVSISGYINYFDDNLAREIPIRRIAVNLFEKDEHGSMQIDNTFTDDDGFYSFRNVRISDPEAGMMRGIYLGISFENDVLEITDSEGELYAFGSSVMHNASGDHIIGDYSLDEYNQYRGLGHVFNCVMDAHDFLLEDLGWERRKITVKWPYGTLSKYSYEYSILFGGMITSDHILLGAGREWNRTTVIHEYGHSVMTALYDYNAHELPEMASERDVHYMYTVSDPGFAMREGWAEFFEALVDDNAYNVTAYQASPGMDTDTPNVESNSWWTGSGDSMGANRQGELVEGAVASILWDIVDTGASRDSSPGVDDDGMDGMLRELWRLMAKHKPANILEVWYAWVGNYYSQPESLYAIYRRYGIKVNWPWATSGDNASVALFFTSGPFVSDVTGTSAVIAWLTDEPSSSIVEYTSKCGDGATARDTGNSTEHFILLNTLSSDTTYQYCVRSTDSNGNTISSEWMTFRTLHRPGIKGDVNNDGEIRSDDAVLTLPIAAGSVKPTEYQSWAADMNDDGRISANDVVLILREVAGLAAPGVDIPADLYAYQVMKPERSALLQNFPNPFNPDTWIPYQLNEGGDVAIRILDLRGRMIREIRLGYRSAGVYASSDRAAYWDGRNEAGEQVSSGAYFYSIESGGFRAVKKMIMTR